MHNSCPISRHNSNINRLCGKQYMLYGTPCILVMMSGAASSCAVPAPVLDTAVKSAGLNTFPNTGKLKCSEFLCYTMTSHPEGRLVRKWVSESVGDWVIQSTLSEGKDHSEMIRKKKVVQGRHIKLRRLACPLIFAWRLANRLLQRYLLFWLWSREKSGRRCEWGEEKRTWLKPSETQKIVRAKKLLTLILTSTRLYNLKAEISGHAVV